MPRLTDAPRPWRVQPDDRPMPGVGQPCYMMVADNDRVVGRSMLKRHAEVIVAAINETLRTR